MALALSTDAEFIKVKINAERRISIGQALSAYAAFARRMLAIQTNRLQVRQLARARRKISNKLSIGYATI
jgi:hypothetical protein